MFHFDFRSSKIKYVTKLLLKSLFFRPIQQERLDSLKKGVFLKNILIFLVLIVFLAAISIGATGSLVSGTSGVFNKVQGEVFQETSSEVIIEDDKLFISINKKDKENTEKSVIDCLNFYSDKYPDLLVYTCDIVVRTNIIIDDSCNYLTGVLTKKDVEESITLNYNSSC